MTSGAGNFLGPLLLAAALLALADSSQSAKRLPIPAPGDVLRAREYVARHDFGDRADITLPGYLLARATTTHDDATLLFARLDEARRQAWDEGRPEELREAYRQLGTHFEIDVEVLQSWDVFRATVEEPVFPDRASYQQWLEQLNKEVDAAVDKRQLFLAREMAEAIGDTCWHWRDNDLHAQVVKRRREIYQRVLTEDAGYELPDGWRFRPRFYLDTGSERAVAAGLKWLTRHQCPDGSWDSRFVEYQCDDIRCTHLKEGAGLLEPTALALLAYAGTGQTHRAVGPFREHIQLGMEWLLAAQQGDGSFRTQDERPVTAQAMALLFLANLEQLSNDDKLHQPLERAVTHILSLQNPKTGAWAESLEGPDNIVTTAWAVLALWSASDSVDVDLSSLDSTTEWLASLCEATTGRFARRPGEPPSQLATAAGMVAREFAFGEEDDEIIERGMAALTRMAPDQQRSQDPERLFFAALYLHRKSKFNPEAFDPFNAGLRKVLIGSQQHEGCDLGTWTPDRLSETTGARQRGRVETTALALLGLELYYMYLPTFELLEP